MPRVTRRESMAITRARLLDAAEQVFAERGFAGASLDQIADRAGYTRGALYANFDGKPGIFLAILDRWLTAEQADFDAMAADDDAAGSLIRKLGDLEGNRFADRRRWLLLQEFRLYAVRNPELLPRLAEHDRRSIAWYAEAIERTSSQAGVRIPGGAERLARIILALEHGIAGLAHVDEDLDHDEFVRTLGLVARLLGSSKG